MCYTWWCIFYDAVKVLNDISGEFIDKEKFNWIRLSVVKIRHQYIPIVESRWENRRKSDKINKIVWICRQDMWVWFMFTTYTHLYYGVISELLRRTNKKRKFCFVWCLFEENSSNRTNMYTSTVYLWFSYLSIE